MRRSIKLFEIAVFCRGTFRRILYTSSTASRADCAILSPSGIVTGSQKASTRNMPYPGN